jgi:poly-beta-hydroxyalkanoate depolymerase
VKAVTLRGQISISTIVTIVMQSVVVRFTIWVLAEVILTMLGTDDLADYCEYIFRVKDLLPPQQSALSEYVCTEGVCVPRDLASGPFDSSAFLTAQVQHVDV